MVAKSSPTELMSSGPAQDDTIVAIATPVGRGGIGVVRISGKRCRSFVDQIIKKNLRARHATFVEFLDEDGSAIDQGIALFFPGPNSFTGEDILELQGHGGPVVLTMLLNRVVNLGARLARPGEFSERAFLNDKIDLSQAEAIADLIDSASQQAARGAVRSLKGEFSSKIRHLDLAVIEIRMFVEAALDFPEEEIDFLSDERISEGLDSLEGQIRATILQANEGALLREGIKLVLAGRPNAGKSSLMNQLSGRESSIVTKIAGTTRDLVNEYIHLDGIPLILVDTAGIRIAKDETGDGTRDEVEELGVRRALVEIENADGLLLMIDLEQTVDWQTSITELLADLSAKEKVLVVLNKTDLIESLPEIPADFDYEVVMISAKEGTGILELKSRLKEVFTADVTTEGSFIARSRHVKALRVALEHILEGKQQLSSNHAGELLAEELRLCHDSLCEITGEFSSDDLLGRIFSSFCIGK